MPILKTLYSLLFSTHTCIWMYLDERNQVEICRPYSVPSRDALDSAHINLICPESVDIWNVVSSSVHQDIRTSGRRSYILDSGQVKHDMTDRPRDQKPTRPIYRSEWLSDIGVRVHEGRHWRSLELLFSWALDLVSCRLSIYCDAPSLLGASNKNEHWIYKSTLIFDLLEFVEFVTLHWPWRILKESVKKA